MSFLSGLFGPSVPSISAQEVSEKLSGQSHPFVLDVRQPEEFRQGHIQGAKLIPLGELERRLKEVPQSGEVVCVCASGNRSVPAVQILAAAGYTASSLKNGMLGWQTAHLPTVKGM